MDKVVKFKKISVHNLSTIFYYCLKSIVLNVHKIPILLKKLPNLPKNEEKLSEISFFSQTNVHFFHKGKKLSTSRFQTNV